MINVIIASKKFMRLLKYRDYSENKLSLEKYKRVYEAYENIFELCKDGE